jgi:hypothetical protein
VSKLINIIKIMKIVNTALENHKGMSDASNDTPVMVESRVWKCRLRPFAAFLYGCWLRGKDFSRMVLEMDTERR